MRAIYQIAVLKRLRVARFGNSRCLAGADLDRRRPLAMRAIYQIALLTRLRVARFGKSRCRQVPTWIAADLLAMRAICQIVLPGKYRPRSQKAPRNARDLPNRAAQNSSR